MRIAPTPPDRPRLGVAFCLNESLEVLRARLLHKQGGMAQRSQLREDSDGLVTRIDFGDEWPGSARDCAERNGLVVDSLHPGR